MSTRKINWSCFCYLVLLIIVHLLGAFGENQDVTVVKSSDINNTELHFSIANKGKYFFSNITIGMNLHF
jgi:hypothetical protein